VTGLIVDDVNVDKNCLSPTDANVSIPEVSAALAQRLELGTRELEASLDRLQDEVVVEGDTVGGNRRVLVALLLPHQRRPRSQAAALIRRPPGGWTSSAT